MTLQTSNNGNPPVANIAIPGDDVSVAEAIANQYREQGIDPNSAYDHPDDALGDFDIFRTS